MTTKQRQRHAARFALEAYKGLPGYDTGDDATTLSDLIGDLLHLADSLTDEEGRPVDGWQILGTVEMHYTAEKPFADDEEQTA